MNANNAGLGLHFLLEIGAMAALVHWGFNASPNMAVKLLLGLGVPLAAAVVWGVFRVPNDPGPAPVAVPGALRLLIEILILGGAAAALYASGSQTLGLAFAAAIVIDYYLMHDRIRSMLAKQ
jgi:hypothetical protein